METHRVWVWGNEGMKTLFRGTRDECRGFKKGYFGYRKNDMYITKID